MSRTPPNHLHAAGRDHPDGPAPPPVCRSCGYNLAGLPTDICPECGRDGPPASQRPSAASLPWRSGLFALILAILFSFFGLLAGLARGANTIPFIATTLFLASVVACVSWFRMRPSFTGIDSELSGEWMMAILSWSAFIFVAFITIILVLFG